MLQKSCEENSEHQTPNLHEKESIRNFPDRIYNCENDKFMGETTELVN